MRTCGTISCYNHGCRCDLCRHAAKLQRRRFGRKMKPRAEVGMCPHCRYWFEVPGRHEWRCPERLAA